MDEPIGPVETAAASFFRLESAGGIVLMVAAVAALLISNSPLRDAYEHLIALPVGVQIGTFALAKPLLLWINDGLMAVFFHALVDYPFEQRPALAAYLMKCPECREPPG